MERTFRSLAFALLAAGAGTTLGFMFLAGTPREPLWWLFFLPFAAWGLAPFALAAWTARLRPRNTLSAAAVLAGSALVAGGNAWILTQAFVVHPDPQSGLVFLFLPGYEIVALAPFLAAARWIGVLPPRAGGSMRSSAAR